MAKKLHLVHVKSHVLDKAPSAETLNYGEIAVNYNVDSPALYIKDDADNIVKFGAGPYAGSPTDGGPSYKTFGIPFGDVDTGSTRTNIIATVDNFPTELTDGVCAYIRNDVTGSNTNWTLNVNGTGAKPVYASNADATRSTTQFSAASTYLFVYNSSRVSGGCWDMYYGYDANTDTIAYSVRTNGVIPVASAKFYRYRLLFTSPDGMSVVPANTSNSTNAIAIRSVNQEPINPFGPIYYYSTTAATESGTSVSASYAWLQYSAIGFGYSFNRTSTALTMTPKAPIYIKCAPQPDGSAIMDDAKPYVQELPSTEDGKIYIYLGIAESATACTLYNYHPVYYYKDGAIRLWTNTPESVVDTAMSSSSTNAVQNKVIKEYVDEAISSVTITVDSELDTGSTNPVANSAVTSIIYEIDEVVAAALNDLNDRKADKEYVDEVVSSITIDVDSEMDSASTNPVQNKVVKEYIDNAISSITFDIDTELDSGSTNPVANSAITSYLTDAEYVISQAFNDLEDRKADKSYVDEAVSSITIDVDSELDSGSTNPVENRVVWEAISAITIDVDEEVDSASTNPVENRAIYEYIAEIEEVVSSSLNDLNDRKADKRYVDSAVSSITIDVDTNLDSASTNPVENRVIYGAIADIEEIAGAALNDLNRRKADKSYVDDAVSSITIDVDTEMDSGSTNPVANSAVTKTILDNERVIAAAFNNLNDRMTGVESGLTTQLSSGSTDDEYPSAKATYDEIHPKVESSMPSGGLHPNVFYNLGTLTGNVTISFATPFDSSVENEYRFRFTAGSTAPTITWPSSITKWAGNCIDPLTMRPTITAGNVYEVSVLDGLAIIIEYV